MQVSESQISKIRTIRDFPLSLSYKEEIKERYHLSFIFTPNNLYTISVLRSSHAGYVHL